MAFSTNCTNKGCGKYQTPFIDKKTDKVYCSECEQEITNLTSFAKAQMKAIKQFREEKPAAFSVKCSHCSLTNQPDQQKDKFFCPSCKKELKLSEAFRLMLIEKLKNANKEI